MKQITDVENLIGKTISKVCYDSDWLVLHFGEEFCQYEVQHHEAESWLMFDDNNLDIKPKNTNYLELFYKGFITFEEKEMFDTQFRNRKEVENRDSEITLLKELLKKYPECAK